MVAHNTCRVYVLTDLVYLLTARIFSSSAKPPPGVPMNTTHPLFEPHMNTGYCHGAGDSSLAEKTDWFEDPYSTEVLTVSRPFGCQDVQATRLSMEQLRCRFREWDLNIERQVIWRAIPYFAKEITLSSNMVVGMCWCNPI
jgi:hypothetical protein